MFSQSIVDRSQYEDFETNGRRPVQIATYMVQGERTVHYGYLILYISMFPRGKTPFAVAFTTTIYTQHGR